MRPVDNAIMDSCTDGLPKREGDAALWPGDFAQEVMRRFLRDLFAAIEYELRRD